jgi:CRP-like cAMP-binding protein
MTSKTELKALTMLRSVDLTHDLDTKQFKKLAALAREVEFAPGEIISSRGEVGKALYLIQAGEVVIETDTPGQNPVMLHNLGQGQFFGWSSLFPGERKMFSTRAVKLTRAFAFEATALRLAWQTDHELEYAIVRRAGRAMVDRLRATRQAVAEMVAPIKTF